MTKIEIKPEEATMVAIDIAKHRNDLLIQPAGKKRYRLSMTNDRADHDRLIEKLKAFKQPIHACFEATGNYHRAIGWRLVEAGFNVHLISSVALARTREALHNGWDKNDPKDAQVMLYMLGLGQVQRYYDPLEHEINDWQEVSKTHEAISRAKTEVLHRLQTHYLPLYFPEVDKFRHSSRAYWFFQWLHRFPTPGHITSLSEQAFSDESWDLMGRKVGKAALLHDIYETAKSSSGLPVGVDSSALLCFDW